MAGGGVDTVPSLVVASMNTEPFWPGKLPLAGMGGIPPAAKQSAVVGHARPVTGAGGWVVDEAGAGNDWLPQLVPPSTVALAAWVLLAATHSEVVGQAITAFSACGLPLVGLQVLPPSVVTRIADEDAEGTPAA